MAEGGVMTDEYRRFLDQPSSNMDDSGFFSGKPYFLIYSVDENTTLLDQIIKVIIDVLPFAVQVISKALEIWGLEMIPFGSAVSLAVDARTAPTQQSGM